LRQGRIPLDVRSRSGREIAVRSVRVEGDRLVVTGSFPPRSVVSFAWTGYYDVTLVNVGGNPATPFRFELPMLGRPVTRRESGREED